MRKYKNRKTDRETDKERQRERGGGRGRKRRREIWEGEGREVGRKRESRGDEIALRSQCHRIS